MSAEAVHFPDTLANSPELRVPACGVPEILAEFQGQTSEEPAELVTQSFEASDEQLLEQVRDGEREALGLLFRRHARAVRNVAYRVLRDEAEADDLVQEVFLFIFRKATLYDAARGKASSWIIHVAYHRAFDRRRYLNSRQFYTSREPDDRGLHLADPKREISFHEQSMEGILGKPLMEKFNSRLTPEQRETIQLYFFEGYALKEIAELTGRSLVNVRSHYYRGLERMRQYVFPEAMRSK
jgi:RNA polymerase sigma-70 factor, ECF subfamily